MTPSQLAALLPCPFCGGRLFISEHTGRTASGHYTASFGCEDCEIGWNGQFYGKTKEAAVQQAIDTANERHYPSPESSQPSLLELRDKLVGEMEDLKFSWVETSLEAHEHYNNGVSAAINIITTAFAPFVKGE